MRIIKYEVYISTANDNSNVNHFQNSFISAKNTKFPPKDKLRFLWLMVYNSKYKSNLLSLQE